MALEAAELAASGRSILIPLSRRLCFLIRHASREASNNRCNMASTEARCFALLDSSLRLASNILNSAPQLIVEQSGPGLSCDLSGSLPLLDTD